jgi:hypothetical protein
MAITEDLPLDGFFSLERTWILKPACAGPTLLRPLSHQMLFLPGAVLNRALTAEAVERLFHQRARIVHHPPESFDPRRNDTAYPIISAAVCLPPHTRCVFLHASVPKNTAYLVGEDPPQKQCQKMFRTCPTDGGATYPEARHYCQDSWSCNRHRLTDHTPKRNQRPVGSRVLLWRVS